MRRFILNVVAITLVVLTPLWACAENRQHPTESSQLPPEMRPVMDRVVTDASIIALSESSHFLEEFHKFGVEAFKYLVEAHDVRLFVLETMWAIEEHIMDYINSDLEDIPQHQALYLNAFDSRQMRELLLWIRTWNRAYPDDRIIVTGYQPEQPVTDAKAIKAFFSASSIEIPPWPENVLSKYAFFNGEHQTDLDSIIFSSGRFRAGEFIYTPEQRLEIVDALIAIEDFVIANRKSLVMEMGSDAVRELEMHVLSLRTSIDTLTRIMDLGNSLSEDDPGYAQVQLQAASDGYRVGDMVRTKIFLTLRETRHQGRRAVIWMHNWHAAKRAEDLDVLNSEGQYGIGKGTASVGSRLYRVLGDDYVVIASLTRCASCEIDRTGSLEDTFHSEFGGSVTMLDLANAGSFQEKVSSPGTAYAQNHNLMFHNMTLTDQFDAVVYFPSSDLTVKRPRSSGE